jgi:aldehyde:ferredoxin oxidoreductase
MFGYSGRILKIDVSSGETKIDSFDEQFARKFLGGNGFAAKLIYDHVPPEADPFSPENALVFTVGPLTDTPLWGTSRGHMAALSPLTGLFADSNYGGDFGLAQKRTGFDAIFISGKSPKPVYLVVDEGGAVIKDAALFWGKTTEETILSLEAKEGEDAVCAAIGPAGENGVLFANILCGGKRFGCAGRAGMGAVMGAKKIKALVVKGQREPKLADPESLRNLIKEKFPTLKQNTAGLANFGTPIIVNLANTKGVLATRNNNKETWESAGEISAEVIKDQYWEKNIACHGCPVACGKKVRPNRGEFAGKSVKMPEYETLYALGAMMDNPNIQSIINGNHMCNEMGIDTISMGVTLAFVAECLDKDVVSPQDLKGEVKFGDGESIPKLIKKAAYREGIGEYLAMGSCRLAEKFGKNAHEYLYAVKGLEIAGHSSRGLREMSLSYATSTRGGSHHDGRPSYATAEPDPGFDGQPKYIFKSQSFTAVGDSLVMCRFTTERGLGTMIGEDMVKVVKCATGWNIDVEELERIGERIYNIERLINVARGVCRKNDTLPYRTMNEPIPSGPAKGRYCLQKDLDAMLDRYYELRGWSKEGIPTKARLVELGLQ